MSYYNEQLIEGQEFQDFVSFQLLKHCGIVLTNIQSRKYQKDLGENIQGIEIKHDKKYAETHNLWIELYERTNTLKEYVESGINRSDNTWLYLIGNYDRLYIFSKKRLKELSKLYEIKENDMRTSKGFLLSELEAFNHAEKIIDIAQNQLEDYL